MSGPGKSPKRGYSWEQFTPGHTKSMRSGVNSERVVTPRAAEIVAAYLARDDTPEHLKRPEFRSAVDAWGRAEAKALLYHDWLEELPIEEQVTPPKPGTSAPIEIWRKLEAHAATQRARLGIDPASAARLAKDMSATRYFASVSPLDQALARIEAERQAATAIEAGDGDDR